MKQKKFSYAKWGYIFALPFCITYLVCMIYPVIYTLVIGFTNMAGLFPQEIGFPTYTEMGKTIVDPFKNFKDVLGDPLFIQSMKNTVIIWVVNFIPQIVLAFILAAWFTNARMKLRGKGFFKVVFYMPNIITAATIAMLFTSLFAYPTGAVNDLLVRLEILEKPWEFPMSDLASKLVVAFIQFWMWYGYTMIVLISGILGISPELFEAADIDGANGVQKFFRITLPNLKQIVLFTLVTSMIGGLQMFDIPNMYNATTGNRTAIRTVAVLIQEKSFGSARLYNQGAAISMIMFAIVSVLAGIIFFVMRDKDEIKQHKIEKAQVKAFKKQMREEKMKEAGK